MPLLPPRAVIREVGLRDGLQSIKTILPTERKKEWIRDAVAAGQTEIEVGSFVPPKLLPQMADTAEVLAFAFNYRALNSRFNGIRGDGINQFNLIRIDGTWKIVNIAKPD